MMKFYATILKIAFIFLTISLHASEIDFVLNKGQKVKSTYSGDIDQKSSIHLIIYKDKNRKEYGIKPFFIDENNKIIELNDINFSSEPTILSYHKNEETLTLIASEDTKLKLGIFTKKLTIIDVNINTKESKIKVLPKFKLPKVTVRLPEKSILLNYIVEEKRIDITNIVNGDNIIQTPFNVSEDYGIFKRIFSSQPKFINTNEYIENGAIDDTKVYYDKGLLYFDYIRRNNQSILSLVLNPVQSNSLQFQIIDNLDIEKIKNLNSFYHKGNLFLMIKTKKSTILSVVDIKTGSIKFKKPIQGNFIGYFNDENLRLIDKAIRIQRHKPTITINKSVEGLNVLRLSYVDKTTYNYHNNWWFHHQMFQNMMHQQQEFMRQQNFNRMPSFGPNNETFDLYNTEVPSIIKENEFIKIVFDNNLNPIKNASVKTVKEYIDKNLYLEPFKDQKGIKHFTAAFSTESIRTIHYSKKSKKFIIETSSL
ncbi:hypothetical protein [uncultured Aquimarina sp.]|uniref:hypothetical protein n=1 Tax=uncultured Aquimarina sp. TaxID=575652 RepID=UPI00260F3B28|nr:hypothetical protein [uncultured Aquimarina sp.]